jgi:hypothetical protein
MRPNVNFDASDRAPEAQRHGVVQLPELQAASGGLGEEASGARAALLHERSIDRQTYERQRDQLREQVALAEIELNDAVLSQIDIDGVLAFAEHVMTNVAESEAAAAAAVLPGRDCIRRKTICSNRRNHTRVQSLNVR